jgi:hypothetical protein
MTQRLRALTALTIAAILFAFSWSDGIVRIRFKHCDTCRATVTLKIVLPFAGRHT